MALVAKHTAVIGDQVQECCSTLEALLLKAESVVGKNQAEGIDWTTADPVPAYFSLTGSGNIDAGDGLPVRTYDRPEISNKLAVLADLLALFDDGHADLQCGAWRRGNIRKSI